MISMLSKFGHDLRAMSVVVDGKKSPAISAGLTVLGKRSLTIEALALC
jgi:hypothetical protein